MECQMLNKSVLLLFNLFLAFLLTPALGGGGSNDEHETDPLLAVKVESESSGGSHGEEGTSETGHGHHHDGQKENQVHSTGAGTKGPIKIMLVDTTDRHAARHGHLLSVVSDEIGMAGIKCSYKIVKSSLYQIYAELNLADCQPPLENPEQLRGLSLRMDYSSIKNYGFPNSRQDLSVKYNMEKEMSAEDLKKFFHGGVFYLLLTHADISKLYVNENGIAIPAAGNHQRQKDLLENQKAAKDGRLTITYHIRNEHQEPVKVKDAVYEGLVIYFTDGAPAKYVTCRADYVEPESTPTQLKFAVELAKCDPPLGAIPDLKQMKLKLLSYSVGDRVNFVRP